MSFLKKRTKDVGIDAEATAKRDEENDNNEGNSGTVLAATTVIVAKPPASTSVPEPTAPQIQLTYVRNDSDMKAHVKVMRETSDGKLVDGEETMIPPGIKTCIGRGDGKDLVTIKLINQHYMDFVATKQKPLIPGMSLSVGYASSTGIAYVV